MVTWCYNDQSQSIILAKRIWLLIFYLNDPFPD